MHQIAHAFSVLALVFSLCCCLSAANHSRPIGVMLLGSWAVSCLLISFTATIVAAL